MSCGIVPLIYQCGPMLSMSQVGISTVLHWVVQLERHTICCGLAANKAE